MNERTSDRQGHAGRFGTWLDHHGYSIVASLGRLLRKPWATLLTVGVMALALALPLGLWLVLDNMARLGGEVRASREIAVFLKQDIDVTQAQAIAGSLRARGDVAAVQLVTPAQALAQLRKRPDLAAAIDALGSEAAQASLPSAQGWVGPCMRASRAPVRAAATPGNPRSRSATGAKLRSSPAASTSTAMISACSRAARRAAAGWRACNAPIRANGGNGVKPGRKRCTRPPS